MPARELLSRNTGQNGPYQNWWTADNVFALGSPVARTDKDAFLSALGGKHDFNAWCLKEYLADDTGKALLTTMPVRFVRTGRLSRMFPRVKVAAVVRTFSGHAGPDSVQPP